MVSVEALYGEGFSVVARLLIPNVETVRPLEILVK